MAEIRERQKFRDDYVTYQMHIKEWIREGKAEGITIGEERGAHDKAVETACEMLSDCMPLPSIAKYTGLSIEELQNITTQA